MGRLVFASRDCKFFEEVAVGLCNACFSLRILVLERTKPRKLEQALLVS